jgi:hypothetical protein
MKRRSWTHRGVTIERTLTGWFTASVYVRKASRSSSYYIPLKADTLGGMRQIISHTMNENGLRAPSQLGC